MTDLLRNFVRESNRIEGITRAPTAREIKAHTDFLALRAVTVEDIQAFVSQVAPGKPLRSQSGMNVRVGSYLPPRGGPGIPARLASLLDAVNSGLARGMDAYDAHHKYETLHPFMDGNGRSGRVLWLWMMSRGGWREYALRLGFLHAWYYQSLEAGDR